MTHVSEFGKFVRMLRVCNNCEYQKDMAKKIGASPASLSAAEIGIRSIPDGWYEKLVKQYKLNDKQKLELKNIIDVSQLTLKVDMSKYLIEDKKLIVDFIDTYKLLTQDDKCIINDILYKYKKEGLKLIG